MYVNKYMYSDFGGRFLKLHLTCVFQTPPAGEAFYDWDINMANCR